MQNNDRVREILLEQMELVNKSGNQLTSTVPLLCELSRQITLRDLANCENIKFQKQKEAVESWFDSSRRTMMSEETYIPRSDCGSSGSSETV